MSHRSKRRRPAAAAATTSRGPSARTVLAVAVGVVALLVGGWWVTGRRDAVPASPARPEGAGLESEEGRTPSVVVGRWRRLDGGYILDIANVQADGTMTAAYLNPRSINVAAARASRAGTAIEVYVELRDVNYPGATYRLVYDAVNDRLAGQYHQPALQQTFDVVFVRATP